MRTAPIVLLLGLLVGPSLVLAEDPAAAQLKTNLDYVTAIEQGEHALGEGDLDAAATACKRALALGAKLRPTLLPARMGGELAGGAAARVLEARIACKRGDLAAARASLLAAAKLRYSNGAHLDSDPLLAKLRDVEGWAELRERFPGKLSCRFAGKTTADRRAGMGLIINRRWNYPKLGELAPALELPRHDAEGTLALSAYRGKLPVALVFGSFT